MATKKLTSTVVKKSIGFDRMSITGKFPSGASLRFFIGRSGEKLEISFSNDEAELKKQSDILMKWLKYRDDEDNVQRFERLEKLMKECKSGSELIEKIK
jgi:hypothetical protein